MSAVLCWADVQDAGLGVHSADEAHACKPVGNRGV